MNTHESLRTKKRRKTEQRPTAQIKLDLCKLQNYKMKESISARRENNRNQYVNLIQNFSSNKKNRIKSNKNSFSQKNNLGFNYAKDDDSRKYSFEVNQTKSRKFMKRFSMKASNENSTNIVSNLLNNSSNFGINNLLENNIIKTIKDMKNQIEKKNKMFEKTNTILPSNIKFKKSSTPNLLIFSSKKKKTNKKKMNSSLLIEEYLIQDESLSFKVNSSKRRSKSFDLSEQNKNKLMNDIKINIFERITKNNLIGIYDNNLEDLDEDSDNNNEKKDGYSFHPNSNIIFIFDLLLIMANLYSIIFIPLNIVKHIDIREKKNIFEEIINYLNDIIYLVDFILSFFRGYYNFEMNIILNNKKILMNYLSHHFITDLLESIPIFSIIRKFMKSSNIAYSYEGTNTLQFIATFSLFIKPFKVFKIIGKKQNKALEDFYSYISENYYLEELIKFIIYFFIFFSFMHLFVCLHLFLSLQSYPNWVIHINLINGTFFEKYIASFYFMVTTITTVGYGDIVCVSIIERIYHIILLVIGTLLYTFLVSKIGNYLRNQSHEQIKLDKDLNILENIRVTHPSMPFQLYSKIKSHLLSIFNKRKKVGISLLINGVPDAIKNDLLLKIYSNVINGFIIFKDVNNSNFVLQVLTSFIPITSKKEEIIVLEGELIQNVIFVKDGRLSMEIAINLDDPYKSIQEYLENNFIGISKQGEIKNYNYSKRVSVELDNKINNYENLKSKIDTIILNNLKKTNVSNSQLDNNGISVDLGRLDFTRNDIKENKNSNNYQIIKIIDFRKNEHYGDVHIFSEQPSPFTVKVKSRIAELFLLRKNDAINISKNFQNIWKRIHNKSYHNLVSIKKLTIKTLKHYYDTHFYIKNKKDTHLEFNLDATRNSDLSFLESKLNASKSRNLGFNNKLNKESTKLIPQNKNQISNNNSVKRKSSTENKIKAKNSGKSFDKDLNLSNSSLNSISINNTSIFEFPNPKAKDLLSSTEKNTKNKKSNTLRVSPKDSNIINKKKTFDNSSFIVDNSFNLISLKNLIKINRNRETLQNETINNEKYSEISQRNILKTLDVSFSCQSENNDDTLKYFKDNTNNAKNINSTNIITLKDINQSFSKKIKKNMKKRKKFQKLKELLKLQRFKINKNILELYSKRKYNLYNTAIISKNKNFSQIIDPSSRETKNISLNEYKNNKFSINFLKEERNESFQIKASYKNMNKLTKGEITHNKKYINLLENLIEIVNKSILNEENIEKILSINSQKLKIENNVEKYSNSRSDKLENEKNKNKDLFSEGINASSSGFKYNNNYEINKKNKYNNELLIGNKINKTYKSSFGFFELDNYVNNKFNSFKNNNKDFQLKEISMHNGINSKIIQRDIDDKKLYKTKIFNNVAKQEQINNEKTFSSNELYESDNRISFKNENRLLFLNKKLDNSNSKAIQMNIPFKEKEKNCIVY